MVACATPQSRLDAILKQAEEQVKSGLSDILADEDESASRDSCLSIDIRLTRPNAHEAPPLSDIRRLFSEDIKISTLLGASDRRPTSSSHDESMEVDINHSRQNQTPPEPDSSLISQSHSSESENTRSYVSRRSSPEDSDASDSSNTRESKRHKAIGGLRLPPKSSKSLQNDAVTVRQLQADARYFSKRRTVNEEGNPSLKPSSLDRFIEGIWTRIHGGSAFDITQLQDQRRLTENAFDGTNNALSLDVAFRKMNLLCRDVTRASQTCRALELIVQARWIDYFNARMEALAEDREIKNMKLAIVEASQDFGWTEKHLRNRMAIWHGYHQIKEAGGWAPLVFSGAGIYRFCKYRIGFDNESMQQLRNLRERFELAADTLHPTWRQLLTVIGESPIPRFTGHPLDWVVKLDVATKEPLSRATVPLSQTYLQWDPNFSYRQIETCEIDHDVWGDIDPRQSTAMQRLGQYFCIVCDKTQSEDPSLRACHCFPEIFSESRAACPVQVFRTADGRNNGLLACCQFTRGTAVGEFVGRVTAGLKDLDIMEGSVGDRTYQIWQGREGNHTRFVNHSCRPNTQFQKFFWLGVERVLLVSKGVEAGEEITVDYSDGYWKHLDKICLCGSPACRYQKRSAR